MILGAILAYIEINLGFKKRILILNQFFPILGLFLTILFSNNFFTYTLDDPYIHLELAKNIFGGNHGINITEFSAPSSSIIFPFLLAPFSNFQFYLFMFPAMFCTFYWICLGLDLSEGRRELFLFYI